jgi:hypothetical protein
MEMLRKGLVRSAPVLLVALALISGPARTARGQYFGYGYGYPAYGYGFPGYGLAAYGYPMGGYGSFGYGYPWHGYGYGLGYPAFGFGYGYPGFGLGGFGFGFGAGYPGFAFGWNYPYTTDWLASFTNPPIMPGLYNPYFGVGMTPLGLQSYLAERYMLGRGLTGSTPSYAVPASNATYGPARP